MDIFRKAKIVAKIADNKSEIPFLTAIFEAGTDIAWLNTAHQDEAQTLEVVKRIRAVSTRVPIMVDTKGPEVRTKDIEAPLEVKAGGQIVFTGDVSQKGPNIVHVTYPNFHKEIPVGTSIFYDDASLEAVVEEKKATGLVCVVKSSGLIKNKKSLNIPGIHLGLPALTEKDKGFIHFCAKQNIDFITHSFVRNKSDIKEIKDILKSYPEYKGKIISKIEDREGFDNLEEILKNSEGIMVARGDLGAEVPLEELPFMQKKMVEAALRHGKYCIVATQVLESMIKNPRPTRAEISDVANAVLDGTGAMSMSGETAYGDYPVEAVSTMGRIMRYTESKRDELVRFDQVPKVPGKIYKMAKAISLKASKIKAKAIFVFTDKIELPRAICAYRPSASVIPVGLAEGEAREIILAYAARPVLASEIKALPLGSKDALLIIRETKPGRYTIKKGTVKDLK